MEVDLGEAGIGLFSQFVFPENPNNTFGTQFTLNRKYVYGVPEGGIDEGAWYAHWPIEAQLDEFEQAMLDEVNSLRTAVDSVLVFPPPQNRVNPAQLATDCMSKFGGWGHDIPDNPEFFQWASERSAFAFACNTSENVFLMPNAYDIGDATYGASPPDEQAAFLVEGYRNSPGHYANMINAQWNSLLPEAFPEKEGALETIDMPMLGYMWVGQVEENEVATERDWYNAPGKFEGPPIELEGYHAGTSALNAQVFCQDPHYAMPTQGCYEWVHPTYGKVSWDVFQNSLFSDTLAIFASNWYYLSTNSPGYTMRPFASLSAEAQYFAMLDPVYFRGQPYYFKYGKIIGACIYKDSYWNELVIRMAIMNFTTASLMIVDRWVSQLHRKSYTGGDFLVAEFQIGETVPYEFGQARFSQNGTSMVVRMEWMDASREITQCLRWMPDSGLSSDIETWDEENGANYPDYYYRRVPWSAAFLHWTRGGGFSVAEVGGINYTGSLEVTREEIPNLWPDLYMHSEDDELVPDEFVRNRVEDHRWSATGTFPVFKDYVGNTLVTVSATVDDEIIHRRSLITDTESDVPEPHDSPDLRLWLNASIRTVKINRSLNVAGKTVPYFTFDSSLGVTSEPAMRFWINYIDTKTGDVSGYKIHYSRRSGWPSQVNFIENYGMRFEFVYGDTVLETIPMSDARPSVAREMINPDPVNKHSEPLYVSRWSNYTWIGWYTASEFDQVTQNTSYIWVNNPSTYLNIGPAASTIWYMGGNQVGNSGYVATEWEINWGTPSPQYAGIRLQGARQGSFIPDDYERLYSLNSLKDHAFTYMPMPETTGGMCDIRRFEYNGDWIITLDHGQIHISSRQPGHIWTARQYNTHLSSLNFSSILSAGLDEDISPVAVHDEPAVFRFDARVEN
jgi:uncharacterized protein YkwD